MRLFRSAFVLLLLLPGLPMLAASSTADAPHVHVELLVPGDKLYRSNQLNDAGVYFKLEQGWHIYWKNAGDAGQPPHIRWMLPNGITASPMQFPAPRRLPLGSLMDFGYEDEVLFPLKLRVANSIKSGPVPLRATVDWLVCQRSCIPGKAELEVQRNVGAGSYHPPYKPDPLFQRFLDRVPRPLPAKFKLVFQATSQGFRLAVETGQQESSATFFPDGPQILDNFAPQRLTPTAKGLILDLKKDAGLSADPTRLSGVLELSGERAFELTALPGNVPAPQPSVSATMPTASKPASSTAQNFSWTALLRAAGLAFLGGVLLNLMPCVFPVLFLKGLALARSGQKELGQLRAHGLVYAAGILLSFWVLVAALLGLRAAGATLGWGFQFQSPVFLALMADLLFFLGLSLAGQFEIGLTLTSTGGSLAAKQGYAGSFFTGVLAVIVATPCTAPFMGAAIGYALAQPAAVSFAVFTALALGLAAPYLALTLQPAWTGLLPRPGAWMEVVQRVVAVPLFATVIWLAWVLAQAYGTNILPALMASFLLLAIAGWFLGRWPTRKWATLIAALILLAVVALAVWGQGWIETNAGRKGMKTAADLNSVAAEDWEPWSTAAVSRYQAQGRPVFVDFTASWCLSCQVNERAALQQPQVQQAFHATHVALLRADWTRHDTTITQALAGLGRSGVPTYALYVPGEKSPRLLPELLTPGIVTDALDSLPKSASSSVR
jgi:thiol:disulfide interchange protein/DsbC/DsbD-like thiol-disulfide interchange protein